MFTANKLRRQIIDALNQGSAPAAILASRFRSASDSQPVSSESTIYGLLRGLENDGKVVATAVSHPQTGEPVWVYSLAGRPTPGVEAIADISAGMMAKAGEIRRDSTFQNWFNSATAELRKVDRERLLEEISLHAAIAELAGWRVVLAPSDEFFLDLERAFLRKGEMDILVLDPLEGKISTTKLSAFLHRYWIFLFTFLVPFLFSLAIVAFRIDPNEWVRLGGVWGFTKPTLILTGGFAASMMGLAWLWNRRGWLDEKLSSRAGMIWLPLGSLVGLGVLAFCWVQLSQKHLYGLPNDLLAEHKLAILLGPYCVFFGSLWRVAKKLPVGITLAEFKRRYYPVPTTTTE